MKHAWMVMMVLAAAAITLAGATSGPASAPPTGPAAGPATKDGARPAGGFDVARPAKAPADSKAAEPKSGNASDDLAPLKAADESKPAVSAEDLKSFYKDAATVVQFQIESFQASRDATASLPWEVKGPVLDVLKGKLLPGRISVEVDSPVRAFDMPRSELDGKQFVAPLKPLGGPAERRFQIVGGRAFAADSQEAEALRKMALTDVESGTGGQNLVLTVTPMVKPFPVDGPKTVEVRLTNAGTQTATYLQSPILDREGRLYLMGQGSLHIRDTSGRLLQDKGNIMTAQPPPGPPRPAPILANQDFVENIDLSKYFNLPAGRYNLVLALMTPDGVGRITSNGFTFQVGAAPLPADSTAKAGPAQTSDGGPDKPGPFPGLTGLPTASVTPSAAAPARPAVNLPDPLKYQPGKPDKGLVALLRPAKSKFTLGEPVEVEFRLIKLTNQGPPNLAVDTRLERTLTFEVTEVGESPPPLLLVRQSAWAPEVGSVPPERAYLHDGSFWGRVMDLNTLYGKTPQEVIAISRDNSILGKESSYEQSGGTIYGFPKPGVYTITAKYSVARPRSTDGKAPAEIPKEWWLGDLQSNTVTIQIGDLGK